MPEKYGKTVAGPLDVRVWLRLLVCSTLVEKKLRRNFADQFGTTLPRFDVLATLARYPEGQTMGDLSKALLVSNGNVTSIVRQLEEEGLISSRPAPQDRRASIVTLTEAGTARFEILARAHHDWIHKAFEGFPKEKLDQLFALLTDLKDFIAKD